MNICDGLSTEYLKKIKDGNYCERILDFYRINEGYRGYYYHRHRREEFMNYGMKIIFTSGLPLTDYEIEYVQDCLRKAPNEDGGKLFDTALTGTQVGLSTDLNLYFDILFGLKDKEVIIRVYRAMVAHAELAGIDLPFDLIPAHRNIVSKHPDRALQIQKAAELFMIMFRVDDAEREFELLDYFGNLSNHEEIKNEMRLSLLQAMMPMSSNSGNDLITGSTPFISLRINVPFFSLKIS